MNNRQAYNKWAHNYDSVPNKTRDLEAIAIRNVIPETKFSHILEIGCGTGKNTEWLAGKCNKLTAVDFSIEMVNKAKEKIKFKNIDFKQADITQNWNFVNTKVDIVTCSLILEHIMNLDFVFNQAKKVLESKGLFYIGELHSFKQYKGSKARFETPKGMFELECYVHHISDYFESAGKNNFICIDLREWFDDHDKTKTPRLISFLFRRTASRSRKR